MRDLDKTPVRPTKRCLDDLALKFPSLDQPLEEIDHPVIIRSQKIPQEVAAGGAERVRTLRDLVWFKVKTGQYRGIVTELGKYSEPDDSTIVQAGAWWWVGAAGTRQQDSETDFYRSLATEAQREGKGTGKTSSAHLLPKDIDINRLKAELAVRVTTEIKRVVRRLISASIRTGESWTATLDHHRITALVRARGSEAYLAVTAEGFIDHRMLAVILGAVPHLTADDWLPEPKGVFGIAPESGQIIYSAIISAESQAAIMDEFGDDELPME